MANQEVRPDIRYSQPDRHSSTVLQDNRRDWGAQDIRTRERLPTMGDQENMIVVTSG